MADDLVRAHLARLAELAESTRHLDLPTSEYYRQLWRNLDAIKANVAILQRLLVVD